MVAGMLVGGWLPLVAAAALGALLGLAVLAVGPVMAVAGAIGLVLAALAFTHSELVIVLVFALASGLFPSQLNPFISLPVGSLQASDLLLFLLLGVVVVRTLVEGRGYSGREYSVRGYSARGDSNGFDFRKTPLDVPMLLFFGSVLVGLGVAVFGFGVDFGNATYELRMLSYYLIFFAVTNLVRTRAQAVRLVGGLIVVAVLLAVLMALISAVGSLPGYTENWALQEEGVARVFHPGYTVSYVGLMILLAYSALEGGRKHADVEDARPNFRASRASNPPSDRGREVRWLLITVLALGVLSTLARNVIVAGAVSMGLLYALLARRERARLLELVLLITVVSAILIVGLVVIGEGSGLLGYADLYLERIQRMFSSDIVAEDENLQPRWEEIQYAWERLQEHPILGIGLYNAYRPPFYRGEPPQLRHFLHNAYLALWIKTGLPGLLAFLWLSAAYVKRGLSAWSQVEGGPHTRLLRAAMLGGAVAFVGLLLSNMVAPSFVQPGGLAVYGLIFGLNEAIRAVATQPLVEREERLPGAFEQSALRRTWINGE